MFHKVSNCNYFLARFEFVYRLLFLSNNCNGWRRGLQFWTRQVNHDPWIWGIYIFCFCVTSVSPNSALGERHNAHQTDGKSREIFQYFKANLHVYGFLYNPEFFTSFFRSIEIFQPSEKRRFKKATAVGKTMFLYSRTLAKWRHFRFIYTMPPLTTLPFNRPPRIST